MSWTENEIETVLTHNPGCEHCKRRRKDWARSFLKELAALLDTEEKSFALQHLYIDKNPAGIEHAISLAIIFFVLRDEMLAWFPAMEHAPGLSNKEYARIQLRGLAEHMIDADAAAGYIDHIQEAEEVSIDYVCGTINSVHELHKEIIAWGLQ